MKLLIIISIILSPFKAFNCQSGIILHPYVEITSYQAVRSQTDNYPCISASGVNICRDNRQVIAISRDLLGKYCFNDYITILTESGDTIKGVVLDIMNKRFTNRIDLLTNKSILTSGWIL